MVPDVLQVIRSHDEIVCDGILQCRDAALDLRPVTNIQGTPREEQMRTYVVCDATSHNPITNLVVKHTDKPAWTDTHMSGKLNVLNMNEMRHVLQDTIPAKIITDVILN